MLFQLVFSWVPVFLHFLLACQPHSKLSAAPIHDPHSFLFLVCFISWVPTILSPRELKSVSFPVSHICTLASLIWALVLTQWHSLLLLSLARLLLQMLLHPYTPSLFVQSSYLYFLSLCLMQDHLKCIKKIMYSFPVSAFILVFPSLQAVSLATCNPPLSWTTRLCSFFLWLVSLQKVLSFYSTIKISPDYKSLYFFSPSSML